MTVIRGFAPILGERPRVLILGSMPSVASLDAHQYYGHPRNAFWWIMNQLLGIDARQSYPERCMALQRAGVAVWDVLAQCERPGSLDAAIRRDSEVVNDIPGLLAEQPTIARIGLNGGKARDVFRRHVASPVTTIDLPSTSPAHAAIDREEKARRWSALFDGVVPMMS